MTTAHESVDNSPSLSVIIPVHGTEEFVAQCLRSVLDQDMADFEVIVVDDASPDNAFEIVKGFAVKDGRLKTVRHATKRGAGGARMTGVRMARGRYIAFVDSDDYVERDFLTCPLSHAQESDADIVEFGISYADGTGSMVIGSYTPKPGMRAVTAPPSVCNKLWKKSFLTENNLEMKSGIYYQDLEFTTRARMVSKSFSIVDKNLYYYRNRTGSTSRSFSFKHVIDYVRVFYSIKYFLEKNNIYLEKKKDFNDLFFYTLTTE